ncbi:hypothetical protein BDY19DRAFT_329150 [Irpex rosettiformis]|uniref:Uncharacterized protein n=1 Tax=Irpex rosettiformis TaxID=378272 RepID=A0ACB8TY43_9APHY|nr:hypothetical protein BDY19DRAFT_329150 [Irpex rosettiformis]
MSGLSNPEIQQLKLERIANCVDYSANVLYLFDSCVTFPREVDAIWGRRWTIMTWLYASTRYSAVLKGIMIFVLAKSLSLEKWVSRN